MWHGGDRNYNPADNGSRVTCTSNTNVSAADRIILPDRPGPPHSRRSWRYGSTDEITIGLTTTRRDYKRRLFSLLFSLSRYPSGYVFPYIHDVPRVLHVRAAKGGRWAAPWGPSQHTFANLREETKHAAIRQVRSDHERPRVSFMPFDQCSVTYVSVLVNAQQKLPYRLNWSFHRIYYYYYYYYLLRCTMRRAKEKFSEFLKCRNGP